MAQIKTSKRFQLTGNETLNGLLQAVIVGALMAVQQSLDSGDFVFNWKDIGMGAVGAGVYYMVRKFTGKPKITVTAKTNKDIENIVISKKN